MIDNLKSEVEEERRYRVANLRADEVVYINREACNYTGASCPHLPMFLNRGRTSEGGHWTACLVCGHTSERPSFGMSRSELAALEARERKQDLFGAFSTGVALGILAAVVCMWCWS